MRSRGGNNKSRLAAPLSPQLNHEKYIIQLVESNPLELARLVTLSNLPRKTTIAEIRRLMDCDKIIRDGMILRVKS